MKKRPWFFEFEDIFHKNPIISPLILIESEQFVHCDGAIINESELGGFDFYLKETFEAHGKAEDTELRLSLDNHNGNNNSNYDLDSDSTQIARDEQRNEIQKQRTNAD